MFTRCQSCHTVHPVSAALLARAGGRFRCGRCKQVGNALETLFDEWPDPGEMPAPAGSLPELGAPLQLDSPAAENAPAVAGIPGSEDEDLKDQAEQASGRLLRIVWITGAVVIALVVGLNVARYFDVLPPDGSARVSALDSSSQKDPPPFRDLSRIEVVSREMIAHPNRPGVLRLDATLANRAERTQPYPVIEVTLFDIENRTVARRRFGPGDYLSRTAELRQGMTPGAYVGVALELPDPGHDAVGFELSFH